LDPERRRSKNLSEEEEEEEEVDPYTDLRVSGILDSPVLVLQMKCLSGADGLAVQHTTPLRVSSVKTCEGAVARQRRRVVNPIWPCVRESLCRTGFHILGGW
jgi:hypothetical protein